MPKKDNVKKKKTKTQKEMQCCIPLSLKEKKTLRELKNKHPIPCNAAPGSSQGSLKHIKNKKLLQNLRQYLWK